jgi:hypothetical protein
MLLPRPLGEQQMTEPVVPAPVGHPAWPAQGLPVAPPAPEPDCRMCGSSPAAAVTFRQHTGMILFMRFGAYHGPLCRDCGLYRYREATAHTLLAGWWGWLSFFITPVVILINVSRRGTVARLPAPVPRPGGRSPVNPGRPLYQRFAIVGVLVPLLAIGAFVAAALTAQGDSGGAAVGRCVHSTGNGRADLVDCGQPHEGVVTSVVSTPLDCPVDKVAV